MSDSKVFMFPESGTSTNGLMSMLAPLLSQKGVDPNVLLALNNRNNDGFGEGGWFMWVIFLFFLMGWGNWGNRGFGNQGGDAPLRFFTDSLINNDAGRELLMSAIQGNGNAIGQLATALNCDINAVQQAINSVQGQICQVGNQVGLSSQQVINAIQLGNMTIAQQLSSCCCDIRESVTHMGYENQVANLNQTNQLQQAINSVATGQERGFSNLGYATQQQTCDLQNTINAGIQRVIDGQSAAELRELQARIAKQNDELSSYKTAGIIAQQLNPISSAIASLQSEVNTIKCAQPSTVTLPNPCSVAVPSCVAAQYGLYGNGLYNGGYWA